MFYIEREDYLFNTRVHQKIEVNSKNQEQVIHKAYEKMLEFQKMLNFYDEDSEVSLINKNAGKDFVKVSEHTFQILSIAKYYSCITNGLFDVTIAPLVEKWKINSKHPRILEYDEIEKALEKVNYEDIILNRENLKVKLKKEGQKIDLGGIAKGYIADEIIEYYKKEGITKAVLNLGGNVKVLGEKDDNELWQVGILEPKNHSTESICSLKVKDKSIVTSGSYERAFLYNGELYHHILNPCTGVPSKTDLKSITIVSEDSVEADALSTPLFIMGKYEASEFMKRNKISGIMVTDDDKIIISKDLIESFSLLKEYEVLSF